MRFVVRVHIGLANNLQCGLVSREPVVTYLLVCSARLRETQLPNVAAHPSGGES